MISKPAFKAVCKELEEGLPLTLEMIMRVFGDEFSMLLVYALMDSADAARAIQGAINRLRGVESIPEEIEH